MGWVVLFLLVLLAAAVPDLCPDMLGIAAHPPDVWILLVLYIAFRARAYQGVGWGIALGVVRDSLSLDPLGTHAFVLGVIAFAFAEGNYHRGRVIGVTRVLFVFVGAVMGTWLYLLRVLPYAAGGLSFEAMWAALPGALWTALAALLLYPPLDRYKLLDDLCGRRHAFSS